MLKQLRALTVVKRQQFNTSSENIVLANIITSLLITVWWELRTRSAFDCCEQKPFYCPTSFSGSLGGSERETLGTRLANVGRSDHNNMLLRATR